MEKAYCICGLTTSKKLYTLIRDKKKYIIVKCKNCRMVYMDPRPSSKELGFLYEKNYYYDDTFLDAKNYKKALLLYEDIKRYVRGRNVLDIGCSKGFLLQVFKKHRFLPFGIEPSQDAIHFAKKNFGIHIQKGLFDKAKITKKFDTITAIDVIEHVQNPLKTLRKMHKSLKQNGVIIIETPNIASLYSEISTDRWMGLDIPFHLYFFTPYHLKVLMEEAGFRNIHITTSHFNILSREGFIRSKGYGSFLVIRRLLKLTGVDPDTVSNTLDRKNIQIKKKENSVFVEKTLDNLDKIESIINTPINALFAKKLFFGDAVRVIAYK